MHVSGRYTCTRQLEHDYTLLEDKVLGTGLSGPVVLAINNADGRKYAVKSLKKTGLSRRRLSDMKNEAEVYLSLDHPHVAKLDTVFDTGDMLHLVMEYMHGGELHGRLCQQETYSEEAAAATTYQMLLAV